MKNPNTPTPKLLSKRQFARRQAALQKKHRWLLKDKPLDIRPGWLHILDTTLVKIKRILTPDDIEQSHLEFLQSFTQGELKIFVDGAKLSPARLKVVEHMLQEATEASELTCFKCGCEIVRNGFHRYTGLCDEHREYKGYFIEDHRHFLAMKQAENELQERLDREKEEAAAKLENGKDESSFEVIDEVETETPVDTSLPILRIYDIEDVKKIKDNLKTRSADADSRGRLKVLCEEMIKRGGDRPYCPLPDLSAFDELVQKFPNLEETITVVSSSVALAKLGDGKLEIPPLLLIGLSGIGKTYVAQALASLFETTYLEFHMESEQAGSSISGSSEFWSNTQTGLVFDALTNGKTANPMILLDELDKAGGDARYDPAAGLYGLLERETAKKFVDLSIRGLPVDASAIIWIITANDLSVIPAPIVSRCLVQHIRPPTLEESTRIAQNIYASIRSSRPWGEHFSAELQNDVLEKIAVHEPRKMKTMLIFALGQAALAGRNHISPFDLPEAPKQCQFGFLPSQAPKDMGEQ